MNARMDLPDGWTYAEGSEFTPYGWMQIPTITHTCGQPYKRGVQDIKSWPGVCRELHLEIRNHTCPEGTS